MYYIYLSFQSYHNNYFVWYIHYFSGVTKVVASKAAKKHQTNTDNNRWTITISCCGLISSVDGPHFYLVKAENIDIQNFKGDFTKKHKAPPGSKVIPTPDSYANNKVWNELAPAFSKRLLDLPVRKGLPRTMEGPNPWWLWISSARGCIENICTLQYFDCERGRRNIPSVSIIRQGCVTERQTAPSTPPKWY